MSNWWKNKDKISQEAERRREVAMQEKIQKIQKAQEIRRRYQRPLKIKVPFWAAILTFRWQLLFQVTMTWSPNTEADPAKGGLRVQWGSLKTKNPSGEWVGDVEEMGVPDLVAAPKPDIDYVWFVDWARGWQSAYNAVARFFNPSAKGVQMLDFWGSVFFKSQAGTENLFLPLVSRPRKVAETIRNLSQALQDGDNAMLEM